MVVSFFSFVRFSQDQRTLDWNFLRKEETIEKRRFYKRIIFIAGVTSICWLRVICSKNRALSFASRLISGFDASCRLHGRIGRKLSATRRLSCVHVMRRVNSSHQTLDCAVQPVVVKNGRIQQRERLRNSWAVIVRRMFHTSLLPNTRLMAVLSSLLKHVIRRQYVK